MSFTKKELLDWHKQDLMISLKEFICGFFIIETCILFIFVMMDIYSEELFFSYKWYLCFFGVYVFLYFLYKLRYNYIVEFEWNLEYEDGLELFNDVFNSYSKLELDELEESNRIDAVKEKYNNLK